VKPDGSGARQISIDGETPDVPTTIPGGPRAARACCGCGCREKKP